MIRHLSQGSRGRALRLTLAVSGVLAPALGTWSCRDATVPYERADHLVGRLDDAVAVEAGRHPLRAAQFEIGFDQRRVLMQHPPSAYRFDDVPAGPRARLSVAPAMFPPAWERGSDGVGFELRCSGPSGEWLELLELQLSADGPGPREAWHPREIPLGGCSSPRTSLELRTDCGPSADCRADWAAWGDPTALDAAAFEPRARRLALLISIDTLRPDRLSLYGARRPTSPALEKLAADGIVFETAVAPAPWTIPSHASLLSSTHPAVHGATGRFEINREVPMLAEVLQSAGWRTAGFVDTAWLGGFGFDRGYDHYDAEVVEGLPRRGVSLTRQRLLDWLGTATGDVFVFWHVMDVHGPYGAPAPFGGRFRADLEIAPDGRLEELATLAYHDYLALDRFRSFDDLVAAYDEGIAAVDAGIGRLLELLEEAGLYDEALIVVTSDHGESLLDHGVWVGHGLFLTDDEIRVPLVIKLPGNRFASRRVRPMVRLLDVAPTVLDVLGVAPPASFEGLSLVDPEPGSPRALPRVAFGMSSSTGARYVRTNREKLITDWGQPRERVIDVHLRPRTLSPLLSRIDDGEKIFDLESDSREATNLAADGRAPERAEALRRLVRDHGEWTREILNRLGSGADEPELAPEQIRQLKALGYFGGGGK